MAYFDLVGLIQSFEPYGYGFALRHLVHYPVHDTAEFVFLIHIFDRFV